MNDKLPSKNNTVSKYKKRYMKSTYLCEVRDFKRARPIKLLIPTSDQEKYAKLCLLHDETISK